MLNDSFKEYSKELQGISDPDTAIEINGAISQKSTALVKINEPIVEGGEQNRDNEDNVDDLYDLDTSQRDDLKSMPYSVEDMRRLLAAARENDVQTVRTVLLLVKGRPESISKKLLECRDKYCRTPLLIAANFGYTETCGLLLDAGANINAGNKSHMTPLMCAARDGHVETTQLLIQRRSNLIAVDKIGRTALHHCTYRYNKYGEVIRPPWTHRTHEEGRGRCKQFIEEALFETGNKAADVIKWEVGRRMPAELRGDLPEDDKISFGIMDFICPCLILWKLTREELDRH